MSDQKQKNSIVRDSSISMLGGILAGLINYAFNILAARKLGPEKFATFGSVMALFYVGSVVSSTITLYVTKHYHDRSRQPLNSMFYTFLKLGLLAVSLLMICSPIVATLYSLKMLYIIQLGFFALIGMIVSFLSGIGIAKKMFTLLVPINILAALAKLVLGISFLQIDKSVAALFWGVITAGLLTALVWMFLFRSERIFAHPDGNAKIDRSFFYMMVIITVQNLIFGGDLLAASKYISGTQAGQITALSTFSKIIFWLSASMSTAFFSYISDPKDKSKTKTLTTSMILTISISILAGILILLRGEAIIELFFGNQYQNTGDLIPYMIFPLIIYGVLDISLKSVMTKPTLRAGLLILGLFVLQNLGFALFVDRPEHIYLIQGATYLIGLILFFPLSSFRSNPPKQQRRMETEK